MSERFLAVEALHRWYVNYDEGRLEVLEKLVTDDVHFTTRSDTGKHPQEATFRCDARGREAALAWTREHRLASPSPLRHQISNAWVTATRTSEVDLEAYMFVTTVVDGRPHPMSSALCTATVRNEGGEFRIARKHVVIDTLTSVAFAQRRKAPA